MYIEFSNEIGQQTWILGQGKSKALLDSSASTRRSCCLNVSDDYHRHLKERNRMRVR